MKNKVFRVQLIMSFSCVTALAGAAAQAAPVSLWGSDATPAVITVPDTAAVELGIRFYADVAGKVLGIRFYKGPSNVAPHRVNLWTGGGSRLRTSISADETARGWQYIRFPKPVPIAAKQTYVASYLSPGYYSADSGYFNRGVSNGVLHAPASGAGGGNGVYRYGVAGSFPNQTWNASNYWVDVVFDDSPSTETIPPTAPAALTAAPAAAQIDLAWQASADDRSSVLYEIRRNGAVLTTTAATRFSDRGLWPSTAYTYAVRAYDEAGNASPATRVRATTLPATPPSGCRGIALGENADMGGNLPFPGDNAWNQDIAAAPVDPASDTVLSRARIGNAGLHPDFGSGTYGGTRIGVPYVIVPIDQPPVRIDFTDYAAESDPGPYPIPANAPIQGLGATGYNDRHMIVVQRDCSKPNGFGRLYETFNTYPVGNYPISVDYWRAVAGAVFDMNSNALRPSGWTAATAAGTPMFPGLIRYEEVLAGEIRHAINFTLASGYTRKAWVHPATHHAGSGTSSDLVPFGARVRLKAGIDISRLPRDVQVIARAMKRYGMIMNDNGGNWFVAGVPDERWDNDVLRFLGELRAQDFELVRMGPLTTR
jgi:hypothetical protein